MMVQNIMNVVHATKLYTEKMVKVFNFTLCIFCHNKKKTRKHDRLFKIQEIIEKQLVFSLDVFRNEIEIRDLFFQVRENTAL